MADGPAGFTLGSSCPALLRMRTAGRLVPRTGLSPSAGGLSSPFRYSPAPLVSVLLPRARLDAPGLGCSPFARHYLGNHVCFLLLGVLRCFSSPRSPHPLGMVPAPLLVGFPIRKSPDQVVFADPRGLSQLITSFLASMSQGIHPSPFSRFSFTLGALRHRDSFLVFFVFPACQRSLAFFLAVWRIRDSNP